MLLTPLAKDQESDIEALKGDRDNLFSNMKIVEVQQIDVSQPQTFSLKCKISESNTDATAGGSTSYGNLTFSSETSEGTKVKFECSKESVDDDGIYKYSCTTDRGFNGILEGAIGSFQEDDQSPLILHFRYESGNITIAESNPDQTDEPLSTSVQDSNSANTTEIGKFVLGGFGGFAQTIETSTVTFNV